LGSRPASVTCRAVTFLQSTNVEAGSQAHSSVYASGWPANVPAKLHVPVSAWSSERQSTDVGGAAAGAGGSVAAADVRVYTPSSTIPSLSRCCAQVAGEVRCIVTFVPGPSSDQDDAPADPASVVVRS